MMIPAADLGHVGMVTPARLAFVVDGSGEPASAPLGRATPAPRGSYWRVAMALVPEGCSRGPS
jgi:hypothetical protein